jgi:hypothetical protein
MRRVVSLLSIAYALSVSFAVLPARAAGPLVTVSFIDPAHFTDAVDAHGQCEATLKTLREHVEALGRRTLHDGQRLDLQVLDVDLAGRIDNVLLPTPTRVLGSPVDWPVITLRYVLTTPGEADRSGEARIKDMAYDRGVGRSLADEPLPYEKRMLTAWFAQTFGPVTPVP